MNYEDCRDGSQYLTLPGELEFVRLQEVIGRHLKAPPATIACVLGGRERYSDWLASLGHAVLPVDLLAACMEQTRQRSTGTSAAAASAAGTLELGDGSVDFVFVLGPLSALREADQRQCVLAEAFRMLRENGVVFASAISRLASAFDGLLRGLAEEPEVAASVEGKFAGGRYKSTAGGVAQRADRYYHLPDELEREVQSVGFFVEDLVALEGPAWLLSDLSSWWEDQARRARLLAVLRKIERERSVIGVSAHLVAVGRKVCPEPLVNIELQRATIRNWQPGDAESLARHANDREVWINLRDRFPHPYTLNDARQWIITANSERPVTNFAVVVDGSAVGGIGFVVHGDVECRSAEIGYWLGREFWGRGIMTEALQAVTEYAFGNNDLCRIYAGVFAWNRRSARVLEKAGYHREARLKKAITKDGRTVDQLIYAIVR